MNTRLFGNITNIVFIGGSISMITAIKKATKNQLNIDVIISHIQLTECDKKGLSIQSYLDKLNINYVVVKDNQLSSQHFMGIL